MLVNFSEAVAASLGGGCARGGYQPEYQPIGPQGAGASPRGRGPGLFDLKPDAHYVDVSAPSAVATGYQARLAATAGALQVLDYSYTVRGWLRGINAADSINPYANGRGDVFYLVLDYNQINGSFNRYDGSIGRMRWGGNRDYFYGRQYAYGYDGAGRLSGTEYTGNTGEDYKVSNLTYDKNGNLLSLKRGVSGGIDALTYSYSSGNSLLSVTDGSTNSAGFSDGNKTGNDYTYWPDGSLRSDLNGNGRPSEYYSDSVQPLEAAQPAQFQQRQGGE